MDTDKILLTPEQIAADRLALIGALGWVPHAMDDEAGRKMVLENARLRVEERPKLMERIEELERQVWENDPETKKLNEEAAAADREAYEDQLRLGIKMAFSGGCKDDQNYRLNWFAARVWYPLKLILCICFRLHPNERRHGKHCDHDNVCVVTIHSAQLYAGWEATYLEVGHGIFRNWYFSLEKDGDWWM